MVVSNPIIPLIVIIILTILLVGIVLKLLKQPHVVAYIIAGIFLGPYGLGLVNDIELISLIGSIGIIILLFFIGMEVSIQKIISNWKIAIFGTFFQIVLSVFFTYLLSFWVDWSFNRILLIGFVISLSSSAVVLKILKDLKEIDTKVGQNVLSILLVQDVAVIPMLIIVSLLGQKSHFDFGLLGMQLVGTVIFLSIIVFALKKGDSLKLPLPEIIKNDGEMQLFLALILCFGFAFISDFFGLSAALGAFVAGILISLGKEEHWITNSLSSFYVLFVAIFFVSIGMLIDVAFIFNNFKTIFFLVIGVFFTNTVLNAVIIRLLNNSWIESFYAGALLSAIGEFSFLLGSIAFEANILTDYGYQLTISIIALTLLLSPLWISVFKHFLNVLEQANPGKYLQKIDVSKIRKRIKSRF